MAGHGRRWGATSRAAAVAGDGVVYAGGTDGSLWAFDAATGDVRWTADTGAEVTSAPAVADGLVVVGNDDGDVVAVDARDGRGTLADDHRRCRRRGARRSPAMWCWSRRTMATPTRWMQRLGDELWDVRTGRETDGPPSIIDGSVFVTAGQDVIAYGP